MLKVSKPKIKPSSWYEMVPGAGTFVQCKAVRFWCWSLVGRRYNRWTIHFFASLPRSKWYRAVVVCDTRTGHADRGDMATIIDITRLWKNYVFICGKKRVRSSVAGLARTSDQSIKRSTRLWFVSSFRLDNLLHFLWNIIRRLIVKNRKFLIISAWI